MNVKKIVLHIVSAVLCLCIAFCGMLAALECTLFKEGFLFDKMQKTEYFSSVADFISAACQGYATDVGLNTVAVDSFLDRAAVRADIMKNVDARYRGVSSTVGARFTDLSTSLEQQLTDELGAELSLEQRSVLAVLQVSCENTYQEATKTPFDAVISIILQYRSYRQWAWLICLMLGAAAFILMKTAAAHAQLWWALRRALFAAAAALLLLSAWLGLLVPYRTWMPQENMAYPLFCAWWGGFPAALAIVGAVLLAANALAGVLRAQKRGRRKPAGADVAGADVAAPRAHRKPAGTAAPRQGNAPRTLRLPDDDAGKN